jgi:hypothetical protein
MRLQRFLELSPERCLRLRLCRFCRLAGLNIRRRLQPVPQGEEPCDVEDAYSFDDLKE